VALDALAGEFAPVPVVGVLEPGAAAACTASRSGRIAVIATEGTVRGGAYEVAIRRRRPEAMVVSRACPLFVALAEEGLTTGPIVEAIARHYLGELFTGTPPGRRPDTLVLGCTHFPVLAATLQEVVGAGVAIVDSASTTAAAVREILHAQGLARPAAAARGTIDLLATDGPERFARVGAGFLGRPVAVSDVTVVDL
jgi:glutamate racemase